MSLMTLYCLSRWFNDPKEIHGEPTMQLILRHMILVFEIRRSLVNTFLYAADVASEHAEGGMYIAPEFLLGQVYDGASPETIVLYRPVYIAVRKTQDDDLRSTARTCGSSTPRLNCIWKLSGLFDEYVSVQSAVIFNSIILYVLSM